MLSYLFAIGDITNINIDAIVNTASEIYFDAEGLDPGLGFYQYQRFI